MTNIEAAKYVLENGCILMRARKDALHQWDVKGITNGGNKRGWFYMDMQTANVMVSVYNALKPENQEKFPRIPLSKLVDFCWKQVRAS